MSHRLRSMGHGQYPEPVALSQYRSIHRQPNAVVLMSRFVPIHPAQQQPHLSLDPLLASSLNHTTSAASTGSPLPLGPCEPLNTSSAGVAGSKKRDGFCRPDFLPTAGGAELPLFHTRFRLRNGVAFPRRRMRDPGACGMTHPPAAGSGTRITGFADRQRSASDVWRIDHERRLPRNPSDPSRHALVRKSDGAPVRHS